MANEFKVRKGLIIEGASGGTVFDVQGSQGQLFSVTDDLSGTLFKVSDISGISIFEVDASGESRFSGDTRFNERVRIGDVSGLSNRGAVRIDTRGDAPADLLFGRDTAGTATGWNNVFWSISSRGSSEGNTFKIYRGIAHSSPYNSEAVPFTISPNLSATFSSDVSITGNISAANLGTASASAATDFVAVTGDTMTGSLTINGNSTYALAVDGPISTDQYIAFLADGVNSSPDMTIGVTSNVMTFSDVSGGGKAIFNVDNVGIGTTNPDSILHVNSENAQGTLIISRGGNNLAATNNVGSITFPADYNSAPTNYAQIKAYANALSGVRGSLDFNVKSTSGVLLTGMTVYGTSSGVNVGIGTTSPAYPLTVNGLAQVAGALRITETGTSQRILMGNQDSSGVNNPSIIEAANGNIHFGNGNSWNGEGGTHSIKMTVLDGGNVGIGETNPGKKLQINSTSAGEYDGGNSSNAGGTHLLLKSDGDTSRTLMSGPSIVFATPANTDGTNVWATSRLLGSPAAAGSARGAFSIQVRDFYDPLSDGTSWNWRTALTAINTGDVGIGTNSPGKLLELKGGDNEAVLRLFNDQANTWDIQNSTDGKLDFIRGSSNTHMRIDQFGHVGIGVTSHSFLLDIGDSRNDNDVFRVNGLNADVLFSGNTTAPTGGVGLWNFINTGTNATTRFYVQDANNSNDRLTFRFTGNGGSNEILSGTSSGNVGIGATSLSDKLHIEDSSAANIRLVRSAFKDGNAEQFGNQISFHVGGTTSEKNFANAKIISYDRWDGTGSFRGALAFETGNGGSHERMRIDENGNVGIGTESPDVKLDVNGNGLRVQDNGDIVLDVNTQTGTFQIGDVAEVGGGAYITGDNTDIDIIADGGPIVTFKSGGDVGINQTNPTVKLDVVDASASRTWSHYLATVAAFERNGDSIVNIVSGNTGNASLWFGRSNSMVRGRIRYEQGNDKMELWTANSPKAYIDSSGNFHAIADVVAYSSSVSDIRLKDNINTIDSALDKVKKLRGVEYTWNAGSRKDKKDLGVIAQEVEEVLPDIVREHKMDFIDEQVYKTVDYEKITAVLIEAIKEQQKQIDELKNQLDAFTK